MPRNGWDSDDAAANSSIHCESGAGRPCLRPCRRRRRPLLPPRPKLPAPEPAAGTWLSAIKMLATIQSVENDWHTVVVAAGVGGGKITSCFSVVCLGLTY